MKTLVFFLEEPSAEEMLKGILSRLLPSGITCRFIKFQGKQDMDKRLTAKLSGWQQTECSFIVFRDQDSGDCRVIKHHLSELCRRAGKENVMIRIACRELESFYLGDLAAVERGLDLRGLAVKQNSRKYRDPDRLGSPSRELSQMTKNTYQKIAGSRAIAPHLDPGRNHSHSFIKLIEGIIKLTDNDHET